MNPTLQLAKSSWPRSGCDKANRSHATIPGAKIGRIACEFELPNPNIEMDEYFCHSSACVITDTMELRVIHRGALFAISLDGNILWSVELRDNKGQPYEDWSSPVALENGACLVAFPDSGCVHIYNDQGECLEQRAFDNMLDRSGYPPNITNDGNLIISSTSGEVFLSNSTQMITLGIFGYDILTPAIYSDDSLAIPGYYGTGFCRVSVSGEIIWRTDFADADLLPTINKQNIVAVGSLNEGKSAFYTEEGKLLGTYDRAAIFAEYSPDAWIALSEQYVAKLTLSGSEIWGHSLQESGLGYNQPIVDSLGHVYLIDNGTLLCFSGEGQLVFEIDIYSLDISGLCCVSSGKMACVAQGKLVIIE